MRGENPMAKQGDSALARASSCGRTGSAYFGAHQSSGVVNLENHVDRTGAAERHARPNRIGARSLRKRARERSGEIDGRAITFGAKNFVGWWR